MLQKQFWTALLVLFFIVGCGGNNTTAPTTPVSKIDSFIELIKKERFVVEVKKIKSTDETKSKTFCVIEVLGVDDYEFGTYEIDRFAFDLSIYEIGDTYGEYLIKHLNKYNDNDPITTRTFDSQSNIDWALGKPDNVMIGTPAVGDDYVRLRNTDGMAGYTYYILEETHSNEKDLEKIGAFQEEFEREQIGELLVAEFGLSEERGTAISKLVQSWEKLANKRQMTAKDANLFASQIIGTDINTATDAYKKHIEGNSQSYESLLDKAASENNTSPEHMAELIEELIIK